MDKCIYIFVIIFALMIPLVLFFILKPMLKHNKLLNGIVNYDTFMKKYVFSITLKKEDFYAQLKMPNVQDILEYTLSDDYTVITFKLYNGTYPYKIDVESFDKSIVLRVEQLSANSKPAFYINEFFIKKFSAKPLDFEKYKF